MASAGEFSRVTRQARRAWTWLAIMASRTLFPQSVAARFTRCRNSAEFFQKVGAASSRRFICAGAKSCVSK